MTAVEVVSVGRATQVWHELTICPDHGVHRTQSLALVQLVAADSLTDGVPQPLCLVEEELCIVRRRQTLQHRP